MLRPHTVAAVTAALAVFVAGCGAYSPAPASAPATCGQIQAFADQLVDIGIAYDYEPSDGPAQLADRTDLVLRGELTGEVASAPASSAADDAYVGYEIAVAEVIAGDGSRIDDIAVVSVPYNSHLMDVEAYEGAVAPGVPVVVFAHVRPDAPGGLVAAVEEGFLTACPDQAPQGFAGEHGSWPQMDSLEAVTSAVTNTDE